MTNLPASYIAADVEGEADAQSAPVGADFDDVDPTTLSDINFDDGKSPPVTLESSHCAFAEDQTNLHRHARYNAQEAVALAQQRAKQFDVQAASDRKTNESLQAAKDMKAYMTQEDVSPTEPAAPLMDRMSLTHTSLSSFNVSFLCSRFRRAELPKPDLV